MKNEAMILVVAMAFASCTSARISSDLASGAIGCSPDEITIINETATLVGARHNFEAICKGKRYICSYQPTTGINCTEALEDQMAKTMESNERYDVLENGILKDAETGLEWKVGLNIDTTWYEGKSWIRDLAIYGSGWRFPTEDELRNLYLKGVMPHNIGLLLRMDGYGVWTIETKGTDGKYVYFVRSGEGQWYPLDANRGMRVIAVRSPKN